MGGFTLPRPRSPGFGSYGCDSGPIKTPPLAHKGCGHVGFPTPPGLNPLGSPHPYTPRPVFRNGRHDPGIPPLVLLPRGSFLRGGYLSGRAILCPPGFRLFSPPARGAFQLSLTVLVRYRSRDVFRVGSLMSPSFPRDIQRAVLRDTPRPTLVTPTGLSPSMAPHSRGLRLPSVGLCWGPCNPTSPSSFLEGFSLPCAGFGRPYSRHPCWFLFLRVLGCFFSPRSRSLPGAPQMGQEVPFGDPGFYGCLRLPRAYRSLPRPSSAPEPSHPPGGLGGSAEYPDFTGMWKPMHGLHVWSGPSPATLWSCRLHI